MQIIPSEALRLDDETHTITAEASACGLQPGEWPERFETTTPAGWTCTYRKAAMVPRQGELLKVIYETIQGEPQIHIFND